MARLGRNLAGPGPGAFRIGPGAFDTGEGDAALAQALDAGAKVSAQIARASLAQKQASAEAGFNKAVTDFAIDLDQNDPNFRGHQAKLDIFITEQMDRHSEGLDLFGEGLVGLESSASSGFNASASSIAFKAQATMRASVRAKEIDAVTAEFSQTSLIEADNYINAPDAEAREEVYARWLSSGEGLVARGIKSHREHHADVEQFNDSILTAHVTRMTRENPVRAIQELTDPEGQFSLFPVEKRQQKIDEAISAYEEDLRFAQSQEDRTRQEDDRREKAQGENALKVADDFLEGGELGELDEFINENRDILEPKDLRYYRRRIAAGGGFGPIESNPVVYDALSIRISEGSLTEGLDIRDAVRAALLAGDLSKADRDHLLRKALDRRFGDAEQYMQRSLKVGERMLGSEAFIAQAKSAAAIFEFEQWKFSHPDATPGQAFRKAQALITRAALIDLQSLEIARLKPETFAERTQELFVSHERGLITRAVFAERLAKLEEQERLAKQAEQKPPPPEEGDRP